MAEEHLDLLESSTGQATEPGAGPPQVMRCERESGQGRVVPFDPEHRRPDHGFPDTVFLREAAFTRCASCTPAGGSGSSSRRAEAGSSVRAPPRRPALELHS
jgi:hypothetical protein